MAYFPLLSKPLSSIPSPSIDRLDKTEVPTPQACIYPLGVQYPVSLCDGLAGYAIPLSVLAAQNPTDPIAEARARTRHAQPRLSYPNPSPPA